MRTREIADQVSSDGGALPLEVMISVMRFHYAKAQEEIGKGQEADMSLLLAAFDSAREAAKDAAPYVHPRLQAHEHSGPDGGALVVEVVNFAANQTPR